MSEAEAETAIDGLRWLCAAFVWLCDPIEVRRAPGAHPRNRDAWQEAARAVVASVHVDNAAHAIGEARRQWCRLGVWT